MPNSSREKIFSWSHSSSSVLLFCKLHKDDGQYASSPIYQSILAKHLISNQYGDQKWGTRGLWYRIKKHRSWSQKKKKFTWILLCCWEGQIFSHQFLVALECAILLLGRDISLPSKSCSYCSPYRRCFKIDVLSIGGKLFLSATKWNNSWMGEAIHYWCLI